MLSVVMKRVLLPLLLFILAASVLFSRSFAVGAPAQAVILQNSIESFHPRLEGSAESGKTIAFIEKQLTDHGIKYISSDFSTFENGYSFSKIISVTLAGSRPDTLILAVPINQPPDARRGSDGSVGIAAALSLAEQFMAEKPELTVRILFLGAEFPRTDPPAPGSATSIPYPLGSKLFLQGHFPEQPEAVLYLNLQEATSSMVIRPGGSQLVAPSWLVSGAMQAATDARMPFSVAQNRILAIRLGRAEESALISPYLSQNIPAVEIAASGAPAESLESWYASFFTFIDSFIQKNAKGFPTDWDHHYLLWNVNGRYLFFSERASLLLLLISIALTLIYAVVNQRRLKRYVRTVLRNAWNLPILLALTFGFLFAATLLLQLFLRGRDSPELWLHSPTLFFSWKLALTLFLSTLTFRLIRRLPISRNGSFYSAAAIFFLFVDVLIAAFINLAFMFYFLFAFAVAFLFSVTRLRWMKFLFLIIAPLFLVKAAWDSLSIPEPLIAQALLLSPVNGNLLLAFVTLPFVLMVIRLDFLFRHPVRGRASFASQVAIVVTALASIVVGILLVTLRPYGPADPQPVTVVERIDTTNKNAKLVFDSPAPLGNLSFQYGARTVTLHNASRHYELALEPPAKFIRTETTHRRFLDREQTVLTVAPTLTPAETMVLYHVSMRLSEKKPMVIYDLNFPFSYSADNREVTVYIGADPPDPLTVDYILPAEHLPSIGLTAEFLGLPEHMSPVTAGYQFHTSTVVNLTVDTSPGK